MDISQNILLGIINDKGYAKKVLPHIKKEYFQTFEESYLYEVIKKYVVTYKQLPSCNALRTILKQKSDINQNAYVMIDQMISSLDTKYDSNPQWLIDETEKWCQERAIFNAIDLATECYNERKNLDAIPELLRKALAITFQDSLGQEFLDENDIEKRWEFYHKKAKKFGTDIETYDIILGGGYEPKTLNCFMAGTNVGKTAAMIAVSANMIKSGHNVLYVTLEMAEEKIAQRYEANVLDVEINDIPYMSKESYKSGLISYGSNGYGRLLIKEYPSATINVNHIRSLLSELAIKRNFKPDVLVVDYLNEMLSCRYSNENLYTTVKSIASELRGLAIEEELCIITATQGNRDMNGSNVSDADVTNVSESIGLPAVCDSFTAIMFPEEFREQNLQIWKILKNRYSGIVHKRFGVRVEMAKGQMFDGKDLMPDVQDESMGDEGKEKKRVRKKKINNNEFDAGAGIDELFS